MASFVACDGSNGMIYNPRMFDETPTTSAKYSFFPGENKHHMPRRRNKKSSIKQHYVLVRQDEVHVPPPLVSWWARIFSW